MVKFRYIVLALLLVLMTTACNLTSAPEEDIQNTSVPTSASTLTTPGGAPTSVALTGLPPLTQLPATSTNVVSFPPTLVIATPTLGLESVNIISPIPGNMVAGNVQILGSAISPNFLQYQLEFGPDPNPGNLWYLIGGVRLVPVHNNLLGIWSTTDGRSPDGLYQVRLRVFLRNGAVIQSTVGAVRVQNQSPTLVPTATQSIPRPIAAFIASPTSGKAPLVVNFTNVSSGTITSYTWNFGDGSTSSEKNPVHTYRSAGSHEVRLTVSGPGGQSNVSTIIDVQTADPPHADFTASQTTGTSPLTVSFTNTSTGPIDGFLWDFGDGVTTNERNPNHTFTEARLYNVILVATGPGGTDRKRMTITVEDPQVQPPVADFIPKATTGNAPLQIQFSDRSTGQVTNYDWNFGDGTTSGDQNPIHTYQNPGTYTVTLTVANNGGQSQTTGTVTVNQPPQAPDASFTAQPTQGNFPLTVQFTNTTTGTATRYEWNFGDGSAVDTNTSPQHTFQNPGTFTVRLTAYGQNNTSDFAEMIISVTEPIQPPNAEFTADPLSGSAPLPVTFTNQSSGDNLTFAWNFGDGNTSDSQNAIVSHTYEANGIYTVTLTATNTEGVSDNFSLVVTVSDALDASFTSVILNDPPYTVQFTSTSSGAVTGYEWDFGDGTVTRRGTQVVTHTYAAPGTYQVRLTVSDSTGASDSVTNPVTIDAPTLTATAVPPTATETAVPATATETSIPATATFTAEPPTITSTPLPALPVAVFSATMQDRTVTVVNQSTGEGITSWFWDFGDGNSSTDQHPAPHTYGAAGNYTITLTVANAAGSSSAQQNVVATDPITAPIADFSFASFDGHNITFTDLSQPAGTITSWFWDFGGLDTSTAQQPTYDFPTNGEVTVTLTVTNAAGSASTSKQVPVSGHVAAPTASFDVTTSDNRTYTFTDTSQPAGTITSWFWDFGDGTNSTDQFPQPKTYEAAGTYPVTLTVTNTAGTSQSEPFIADVPDSGFNTRPTPDTGDSIADTTPIQPDMNDFLNLRNIVNPDRNDAIFALAGDRSITQSGFMRPFGDGNYTLDDSTNFLTNTIDAYVGTSAFDLDSVAVGDDFRITNLLNDTPDGCDGETRFVCELTQSNASIVVISIGLRDAQQGTDPQSFRADYESLLTAAMDRGVVPIALTIYPRPGDEAAIRTINEAIIEAANAKGVPVVNIWRLVNEIGGSALDGNDPSVGGGGADVLTGDTINTFGENARNFQTLDALQATREMILQVAGGRRSR